MYEIYLAGFDDGLKMCCKRVKVLIIPSASRMPRHSLTTPWAKSVIALGTYSDRRTNFTRDTPCESRALHP